MVHGLLRGGAVATALAATIGLASTLTACASSTTTANAGSAANTVSGTVTPTPTSSSTGATSTPSGSINPGGPVQPIPSASSTTAQAQSATLPSGAKYVAIDHMSKSTDGRTLYLQTEAQGGACGNYTVVVQESSTQVHVGLAKLPVKTGVMCPMYVAERTFPAKLSSPVGNRAVIDLATNAPVGS
jgi:hypothetical protein